MSIQFLGGIDQYRVKGLLGDSGSNTSTEATDTEISSVLERPSLLADALSFQRHRNQRVLRPLALFTLLTTAWLFFPRSVFAKEHKYIPVSQLAADGLTQTPDAALMLKIQAREGAERAKLHKAQPDVQFLTPVEMKSLHGRGVNRNQYLNGTLPWQRSLRDVNLCNGNLFKSFTDVQVTPGRGAGLAMARTYNSNDDRVGPFGTGWTHAYDIRIEEAPSETINSVETEIVPRTDFFGGKHKYVRDADGLYTPPAYLYDEMDSRYDAEMIDGMQRSLEDSQKDMSGDVKHFVPEGLDASGNPSKTRVCDYIEDRFGSRTTLTYGQTVTFPDGSTKNLLTEVKDPVNRTLTFTWQNLGTTSAPAYRITSVAGPVYTVTYEYYTNPSDTSSYLNLWKVHLDSTGLDRTTTYTYTTCAGETGLLASIADPLGETVSYTYTDPTATYTPTNSVWVSTVTEPAGVDASNAPRTQTWYLSQSYPSNGVFASRFTNRNPLEYSGEASIPPPFYAVDLQLRAQDLCLPFGGLLVPFSNEYDPNNNVTLQVSSGGSDLIKGSSSPYTASSPAYQKRVHTTYGPHGNVLTQSTEGFSGTTTTEYYDASKYFQKASVTDALGHTSTFDYYSNTDPSAGNRGNVKWVRDAGYTVSTSPSYNKEIDYTYNQYGQKASETNLNNVTTSYTYGDSWGNLTQVVQDPGTAPNGHLNRVTSMVYNAAGNVIGSTSPNGETSTIAYNKLGQPLTASAPTKSNGTPAEVVSYVYAVNGRTMSVTDNRGTTSMTYEPGCDRLSTVTDPITGTTGYKYNKEGMRTQLLLPGNGMVAYNFDQSLASVAVFPKDDPNSWTYPLTQIIDDQNRKVDFIYTGTISSQESPYQSVSSGTPGAVRFNQIFDNTNGQLLRYCETKWKTEGTTSAPALIRGMTERVSTVSYIRANTSSAWTSTLLNQNDYTYNNNGQRISNTVTTTNSSNAQVSRTENYIYDELSRLKEVNYGDGQAQAYFFDAMGNRTSKLDNVDGNMGYQYDNANRLTSRGLYTSIAYTNDANGNTLTNGSGIDSRTNVWDSQNRLTSCSRQTDANGSMQVSQYRYGADGLRRRSNVQNLTVAVLGRGDNGGQGDDVDGGSDDPQELGTITHYGYDGTNVVREWTENNATHALTISATYLIGLNGPMYRSPATAADVRWYVYDGLGSVVGEVDVNGVLMAEKKHDVYGNNRGVTGTSTSRHGFVGGLGHYSDEETGLIYMRARYYDPSTGRFISEDPAKDGVNWLVYCNNDPVNRLDRDGKATEWIPILVQGFLDFIKAFGTASATSTLLTGGAALVLAVIAAILNHTKHEKSGSVVSGIGAVVAVIGALMFLSGAGLSVLAAIGGLLALTCFITLLVFAMVDAIKVVEDPTTHW